MCLPSHFRALPPSILRHPTSGTRLAAAVVGRRADALALADLHARLGVVGSRRAHPLLDLAGHGEESLLNVARVLGRGLQEGNAQAVGKFLYMAVSQKKR